ncbi:23 kDa jasmonate-induced protein [Ziziphus jujuba]|uniref:23 kDa jasmonate-induced protein n=1 Tax=Ziziphus jujuba TaxID=326968 RepID=A0A6P4AYD9_ZIZJJ|nr:23 kDa jasmonate-induced protein [Ziziphus jujuba]
MGDGLFGNPITNSTLEGLPDYVDKKNIERKDRARVALNMKNAEEKSVRAGQYLQNMKEQCNGDLGGTLCLLYNATGDPIRYVTNKDFYEGHVGPTPYPIEIANGQWAAFLHVPKSTKSPYSVGAIVYRGKDPRGVDCDWMVSWDNATDKETYRTKVYSEVREKDYFFSCDWEAIYKKTQVSGVCHDGVKDANNRHGCSLSASIGNSRFPHTCCSIHPARRLIYYYSSIRYQYP